MTDLPQTSPRLALPYLQPAQAQKHVTVNTALGRLDALVQAVVADRRTDPPEPVEAGAAHLVAAGGIAAFAGQDHALAVYDGVAWAFYAPQPGWRVHVRAEATDLVFDGTAWGPLPRLGIGAAPDAANPLSVAGPATLLSHVGAGHQLKINKAAAGDTASLLFQSGWSGRAEMGLAGSDGFEIKVSADGAAWTTGLRFDPATGHATGAAIQQAEDDTTPGRLARADYAYGKGNLLGPVGLAGGQPTGAVIDAGTGPGGRYTRLADGTQIVTAALTLSYDSAARLTALWSFPVPFADLADLAISGTLDQTGLAGTVAGPGSDEMLGPHVMAPGAAAAEIRVMRIKGAPGFQAGDTVTCRMQAIGRWA